MRAGYKFAQWLLTAAGMALILTGLMLGIGPHLYQSAALFSVQEKVENPPSTGSEQLPVEALPEGVSAILSCSRLNQELVVFRESKVNMLKGPVWLTLSSPPGAEGNSVIAAHRDSHFRFLKDVEIGDRFELKSNRGKFLYSVIETKIVKPEDRRLLAPLPKRAITLVTCYPFYFVGPAKKRFIVRAVEVGELAQYRQTLPERLVQEK